jgi:hypothetical protein
MLTALDANPNQLDEQETNFIQNIREFGWFRTSVFPEDGLPGFSYSTGFWNALKFPELITFSLKSDTAHQIFWNVFNDLKGGRDLVPKKRLADILDGADIVLIPVNKRHYAEHLGWSSWFYRGDGFPCLQLIWPDRNNAFPWQGGFEREFENDQPDLSEGRWDNVQLVEQEPR